MVSSMPGAVINFLFGLLFTFFAVRYVSANGWGLFAYILVFFATLDIGSSLQYFFNHFAKKGNNIQ